MPTGLTYKIYSGEDMSLRSFVLTCCGHMAAGFRYNERDARVLPTDRCPVCEYGLSDKKSMVYYENELENFLKLKEQPGMELLHTRHMADVETHHKEVSERLVKVREQKARYEHMLNRVCSLDMPVEYTELKELMIDQLEKSLKADCSDDIIANIKKDRDVIKDFDTWLEEREEDLRWNIDYHRKAYEEAQRYQEGDQSYLSGLYKFLDEVDPMWDVSKAKDGDYLFISSGLPKDKGMIVIFKELERTDSGEVYQGLPHHDHCRYDLNDNRFEADVNIYRVWRPDMGKLTEHRYYPGDDPGNVRYTSKDMLRCGFSKGNVERPATKEERELLDHILMSACVYFDRERMGLRTTNAIGTEG